ncbi:MAG: hypothetical protein ACRDGL_06220, partial [Candidatus Limnocylindrales bacterium]
LIQMRTTLVLEDALLRQARKRALQQQTTLSAVVNDALREALRPTPAESAPDRPFSMVTYGSPQRPVQHAPADFAVASEAEDRQALDR